MRRLLIGLLALAASSCGGSDYAADAPPEACNELLLSAVSAGSNAFAAPTWASAGRSLVFHGDRERCSFDEVEAHPE